MRPKSISAIQRGAIVNRKVATLIILLFVVQYAIGGWPPAVGSIMGILIAMAAVTIAERKSNRSKGDS
jgi:uncharacterized membrane protein